MKSEYDKGTKHKEHNIWFSTSTQYWGALELISWQLWPIGNIGILSF